jgi:hypothetical protein
MSEGGEPSAPATPGLLLLSYTTPRDAASQALQGYHPINTGRYETLQCTAIERALELTNVQKYVSYV